MGCDEIKDWLDNSSLDELKSVSVNSEIRQHLDGCASCRAYYRVTLGLRDTSPPEVSSDLYDRLSQRIETETAPQPVRWIPGRLWGGLAGAVATVIVVLGLFILPPRVEPSSSKEVTVSSAVNLSEAGLRQVTELSGVETSSLSEESTTTSVEDLTELDMMVELAMNL